jgi:hypothetical protein
MVYHGCRAKTEASEIGLFFLGLELALVVIDTELPNGK